MNSKFLILLSLSLNLLWSCQSDTEDPIDPSVYGHEYFPLEIGKYRVYQVDSIQFDIGNNNLPETDSSRFYIREEIKEVIEGVEGEQVYRIERYRTESLDEPWSIMDVTTETRGVNQAMRTEGNLRFINLIFPMREGITWDGNLFLPDDIIVFVSGEAIEMYKNWSYEFLSVDQQESVEDLTFSDVATVQQANDENEIEFRWSQEKYAKNVGLIYRERWILDSYCKYTGDTGPCIGLDWRTKSGRGFIMREQIIDHN